MKTVVIHVNREAVKRDVPPRMHLADFLREEARCTGTHLGCEHGVCGACTVLIDSQPVRSCITFAAACDGATVTTVEGYDDDPVVALLRPAFSKHHALQCGFCTPGMLATSRDIVLRFPQADEARVRLELAGNICRCTGYMGIVRAILDVLDQCKGAAVPAVDALRARFRSEDAKSTTTEPFATFKAKDVGSATLRASSEVTQGQVKEGTTSITGAFDVPYPTLTVWEFMADLPSVAACLPGAELTEHSSDMVKGKVAIKFGPMTAAFVGAARLERNDATRSAVLRGAGQDSLSKSRASGDVNYRLVEIEQNATRVEVNLEYSLQGPLAQFSRSGLVKDFVGRLIKEFGRNVEIRMDPSRLADAPLPQAKLNAFSLGLAVLWDRLRRFFRSG